MAEYSLNEQGDLEEKSYSLVIGPIGDGHMELRLMGRTQNAFVRRPGTAKERLEYSEVVPIEEGWRIIAEYMGPINLDMLSTAPNGNFNERGVLN